MAIVRTKNVQIADPRRPVPASTSGPRRGALGRGAQGLLPGGRDLERVQERGLQRHLGLRVGDLLQGRRAAAQVRRSQPDQRDCRQGPDFRELSRLIAAARGEFSIRDVDLDARLVWLYNRWISEVILIWWYFDSLRYSQLFMYLILGYLRLSRIVIIFFRARGLIHENSNESVVFYDIARSWISTDYT